MDFCKSLLILSFSCLLFSSNAIPLSRVFQIPATAAPAYAPNAGTNLLGSFLTAATKQITPEILKFCTGTENPLLCAETIAPFIHGSFDPIKALETEIETTLNHTKTVVDSIAKLLSDASTSKKALDALKICKTEYEDISDTIKEVVALIKEQNVVDAYYKFSSVISDESACEDAFQESPGVDNPFPQDSKTLFQLGGNCLAIMDGIVNNNKLYIQDTWNYVGDHAWEREKAR